MKRTIAAGLCLLLSATAQSASDRSTDEIKRGIADAVRRYANAIACPGIRVRTDDVLTLVPHEDDDRRISRYAVLWTGDLGCFGGADISSTYLAIATVNSGKYVVDPRLSSPIAEFEAPVRVVRRVVSYTEDTLTLQGNVHSPQDPRDKPSIPVRFTLKVDEKGNWKLTDKRVLPVGTAGG